MRLTRKAILPITLFIFLACTSMTYASVVTVDAVAKKATSDVATLNPSSVKASGEQIGVFVKNTIPEPQIFTMKINGLGSETYDVYINHEFKGSKSAKEFEAGVEYRIDGRITDPDMMRCLSAVSDSASKAYTRLNKSDDAEAKRICYTLNQAKGWAQSGLKRDEAFRSISLILAPSGRMVQPMTWLTREGDYETARAVTRGCWLLQQARDQMNRVIKNPTLRNDAVLAMTPVELSANYSVGKGKPHVEVKLLNKCDLPVSGSIYLALPKGWKTTAKTLSFNGLGAGKTFSLSVDLVAPSAKAIPPDNIPTAARLTVAQDLMTASMKLNIVAGKTSQT